MAINILVVTSLIMILARSGFEVNSVITNLSIKSSATSNSSSSEQVSLAVGGELSLRCRVLSFYLLMDDYSGIGKSTIFPCICTACED